MHFTVVTGGQSTVIEAMDVSMEFNGREVCAFWIVEGDKDQHVIVFSRVHRLKDQ